MERAEEIFTLQLARAAGKTANKFLHSRGLQQADRDDVIAAAMLWCWQNRDNYSLTTTLETWFMNAVRDAYKSLRRAELPLAAESIDELIGEDVTYNTVAAESSAAELFNSLTATEKEIIHLKMEGFTREELREKGFSTRAVHAANKRIKQLHRLIPEERADTVFARTNLTGLSDDADDALSPIDLEIEQLEFAPPQGKDCPPCWKCKWFEGLMPDGKRSTRMTIVDLEVREAVKNTEERKIEIAQQVRDGIYG